MVCKFGPLINQSGYQVEDRMGKIANSVKAANKVSEQVFNKSMMAFSIISSISQNYSCHSDEFKKYMIEHGYFSEIFEPQDQDEKIKLIQKKYSLTNEGKKIIAFSPVQNVKLVGKVFIKNFYVSPNNYSNDKCEINNNKTKFGNYYVINNIIKLGEDIYLFCYEYHNLQPYPINQQITFEHIKYTFFPPSQELKIILPSEIESPFSLLFIEDFKVPPRFHPKFILFDLFNCHL